MTRYASMAELRREMHPRGTDAPRRSIDGRRGRIEPDAPGRPIAGGVDIRYGSRRPRETFGTFAGHDGTEKAPASKLRLSWRLR